MTALAVTDQREKKRPFLTYKEQVERAAASIAGEINTSPDKRHAFSVVVVSSGDEIYHYILDKVAKRGK